MEFGARNMEKEDVRDKGGRRFRLLAMTLLPVALLALGVAGYRHYAERPGAGATASAKSGGGAGSSRWTRSRHGPRGPRYGHSGGWERPRHRPPVVEVQRVKLVPWKRKMTFYGQVVARQRLDLRMPVSGRIVELSANLRVGARVREGERLVRLDDENYRAALQEAEAQLAEVQAKIAETEAQIELEEASLENARHQLRIAERDLARKRRLLEQGAAARKAVDEAALAEAQKRLSVLQKTSAIRVARARLAQYRAQAQRQRHVIERARKDLRDTVLHAPFDGRVLSSSTALGQYVTPSDRLATLVARNDLEVRFAMSQDRYGDLLASGGFVTGLPVRVVWKAGRARRELPGRIERLAPEVDENNGSVVAFATFDADETEAEGLRIGSFVDVILEGPELPSVARLPEGALHDGLVYVISEGRLIPRKVRPLAWENGTVLIDRGLKDGDVVMASHLPQAKPGMHVRVAGQ